MVTLAQGPFEARELLRGCDGGAGCEAVGSEDLRRLVPPRQRYGYDLIVHVGLARYLGGRQREEIRTELHDIHGIDLSDGTVSNLCDRFLVDLERQHLHRAPALRAAMEGGYPLHVDARCEQGRGGLFVALDGWRGWVLGAGFWGPRASPASTRTISSRWSSTWSRDSARRADRLPHPPTDRSRRGGTAGRNRFVTR